MRQTLQDGPKWKNGTIFVGRREQYVRKMDNEIKNQITSNKIQKYSKLVTTSEKIKFKEQIFIIKSAIQIDITNNISMYLWN